MNNFQPTTTQTGRDQFPQDFRFTNLIGVIQI
jgi:hypothetical protein